MKNLMIVIALLTVFQSVTLNNSQSLNYQNAQSSANDGAIANRNAELDQRYALLQKALEDQGKAKHK